MRDPEGMTAKDKIWRGIAEILAGQNTGDEQRSQAGQEMIRQALDAIPEEMDKDMLMELHNTAMAMCEIAMPCMVGDNERARLFLQARERHQKALTKLEGG